LHCFGSIEDTISLNKAIKLIKHSETEFLTIYTHGNIDKYESINDFSIGYSGLTFQDIKPHIELNNYTILININHAVTVDEAIARTKTSSRLIGNHWIKLEVLNSELTQPINRFVIQAAKSLTEDGHVVLPLINANEKDAKTLESMGCVAIRVLMSDIGSEKGMLDEKTFRSICNNISVPIIAEGGLGKAEDAAIAIKCGASAILTNKALFCNEHISFINSLKKALNN